MPGLERFPRCERLTRKRDYEHVYRHGQKFVGRNFVCYVVRQTGQGRKFGLAVSRKVGRAVVRNRVKRYLREIYRTRRNTLKDGFFIVIVARPACARLDFHESANAIDRLFREGKVLSD